MAKHNHFWRVAGLLCLVVCLCVTLIACNGGDDTTGTTLAPTVGTSTYKIQVSTASGVQLKNLSVYVYTDATMEELETMKQLDENGAATFTATTSGDYVVVLMGVPEGYNVQEYYTFDSKNEANIVLTSSVIAGEKPAGKNYALGDVMYDFTITGSDGAVYTLSELLKEKDAVVLNFWYLNCSPCKIEFPYLEMAYAEYSDRIELLAINCEDGNDAELNTFKADNELTFPMAIGDKDYWYPAAYSACPTTIVVDRYGMIVYMHAGYFDEVAPFNALFRLVTGEDYEQTLITDIESLITDEDYRPDGSEERPYELGGVTEFDIKIPANGKVHYNLYRLMNVTMRIENKDAYVIIDGVTHYPVGGVIEVQVSCEDTFTPVNVVFGNTAGKKNDVHVAFIFEPGNVNNPIELVLGENQVTVTNVNGLGTYYTYSAATSGTLVITVQGCTDQATPDIQLYNHNTFESKYLAYDGVTDEETGLTSVSIAVNAGDVIQIIFSAATEPDVTLTSVTIQALASILEGEGSGVIDGRTGYSVSVVDQDGNPVPGVKLSLTTGGQSTILTTDETGAIGIRLTENAYFLELMVPSGYAADTTSYLWSPANPHLQIRVVVTSAFTVKVQKHNGTAVTNVLVKIYADPMLEELLYAISTDENGMLTFIGRVDTQYYAVLGGVEAGLAVEDIYTVNSLETTITLLPQDVEGAWCLGDEVPNFAVTDIDGNVQTLNWLLRDKDLVVLTFWKSGSVSSVQTLSNLQKVYEIYGDRMAVLALDPVDQLEMELIMYRGMYNWTFPLALCDASLAQNVQVQEYPTTVIIDREGRVCMMHSGTLSQGQFMAVAEFYLADGYVHTTFDSIDALMDFTGANGRLRKTKEDEA